MRPLPINEIFTTFQGEGVHTGSKSLFVRTHGCPVRCPWCDSAGTWHADYKPPDGVLKMTAEQILAAVAESDPRQVVFTGGEPTIHREALEQVAGMVSRETPAHIETCGAMPFDWSVLDWVVVSPKRFRDYFPTPEALQAADEIKIIVDQPAAVEYWPRQLDMIEPEWRDSIVWLHPEWSRRCDQVVLDAISKAVDENKMFRAGWQIHKEYMVDLRDPRSRKTPVPLGGDPKLGY